MADYLEESTDNLNSNTTYQPQLIYRIFALISLVIAALFVWDLRDGVEIGAVLFLAVSVGTLLWAANKSLLTISVEGSRFILHRPLGEDVVVDFGQIIDVSEEGRMLSTLVVNYHPREQSGLLDLDSASSLILPALKEQEQLLSLLQEKTPA